MHVDEFIADLWEYALTFPMREHPWFQGIANHRWTREQIILGEVQHFLRVRENPVYFGYIAAHAAEERLPGLTEAVLENYMEELAGEKSHVDIMYQFLEEGGVSRYDADHAEPTPGTLAAIEMILGHCERRSALEGVAMLAFVESQHGGPDGAAALVYPELIGHYGFSEHAAETYKIHAEQDVGHGSRQIELLRQHATDDATQERVRRAVKLGLNAWNLEWDGHVQAMTGKREYWAGPGHSPGPTKGTRPAVERAGCVPAGWPAPSRGLGSITVGAGEWVKGEALARRGTRRASWRALLCTRRRRRIRAPSAGARRGVPGALGLASWRPYPWSLRSHRFS